MWQWGRCEINPNKKGWRKKLHTQRACGALRLHPGPLAWLVQESIPAHHNFCFDKQFYLCIGLGAGIFFGRGVPNLQKVGVNKTATPLFRQQKFYKLRPSPSPMHLPPKQVKIVLKSVFLNKTNTLVPLQN